MTILLVVAVVFLVAWVALLAGRLGVAEAKIARLISLAALNQVRLGARDLGLRPLEEDAKAKSDATLIELGEPQ